MLAKIEDKVRHDSGAVTREQGVVARVMEDV